MGTLEPCRRTSKRGVSHQGAGKHTDSNIFQPGHAWVYSGHCIIRATDARILVANTHVSYLRPLLKCICWSRWLLACLLGLTAPLLIETRLSLLRPGKTLAMVDGDDFSHNRQGQLFRIGSAEVEANRSMDAL